MEECATPPPSTSGITSDRQDFFKHKPLSAGDSFRVIELLPGNVDAPIACRLSECRLSCKPVYDALSYEWGDPAEKAWLLVDMFKFRVRLNLWRFLEQLRRSGDDEPDTGEVVQNNFFIDAVCIDQENVDERNVQVALMSKIYAGTDTVHIWLGAAADGSDEVLDACLSGGLRRLTERARLDAMPEQNTGEAHRICRGRKANKVVKYKTLDELPLESVFALLSRTYWERVWIIQELLFAQSLELYCGSRSLPWEFFEILTFLFPFHISKKAEADIKCVFGLFGDVRRRQLIQNTLNLCGRIPYARSRGWSSLPLPTLLSIFQAALSTDVRDKVYGLLGLSTESKTNIGLQANYANGANLLFFEVMSFCKPEDNLRFAQLLLNSLDLRDKCSGLISTARSYGPLSSQDTFLQTFRIQVRLVHIGNLKDRQLARTGLYFRDVEHKDDFIAFELRDRNMRSLRSEGDTPYLWFTKKRYQARAGDRVCWFVGTRFALIYRQTQTKWKLFNDPDLSLIGIALSHDPWPEQTSEECRMLDDSQSLLDALQHVDHVVKKRSIDSWVQLDIEQFARLLEKSDGKRLPTMPLNSDVTFSAGAVLDVGTEYARLANTIGPLVDSTSLSSGADDYSRKKLLSQAQKAATVIIAQYEKAAILHRNV
jgi:hypothetical protein